MRGRLALPGALRRARLAMLGALLVCAAPVWAQDAAAWLTRMGEALRGLDYHGDLVYAHAGQIETLRVFHAAGPEGERERLITVSGAAREIIRVDGRVICVGTSFHPTVYGDSSIPTRLLGALPGSDATSLQTHYVLTLGANERIAGLDTQLLEVRPRDAYRYGYRLWLERESGMLLKSVRFGVDGRPVEQLIFTRIALRERPSDSDLSGNTGLIDSQEGATRKVLDLPQPGSGQVPGWNVVDPPAGFILALQQPVAAEGSAGDAAEHLIYSDGIASVSVYVEPLSTHAPAFSGPASRGAVNLYGRVLDGRQITVLGDVPAATVERFAQGVAAAGGG